jgi:hypothetical protein
MSGKELLYLYGSYEQEDIVSSAGDRYKVSVNGLGIVSTESYRLCYQNCR